ncbi:hypothetical protein CALCODRAFT_200794 [Calocera cornea HHB12733]|uniref:Uncharacterized protein n=1 Tax=Calocera cornea HHB12733 TaxID=1353952 RepID=A0A165HHI1_9BASI|nr:hypothetical protein CALCODRAFT_200794 [Calocera cornea HHB12733]
MLEKEHLRQRRFRQQRWNQRHLSQQRLSDRVFESTPFDAAACNAATLQESTAISRQPARIQRNLEESSLRKRSREAGNAPLLAAPLAEARSHSNALWVWHFPWSAVRTRCETLMGTGLSVTSTSAVEHSDFSTRTHAMLPVWDGRHEARPIAGDANTHDRLPASTQGRMDPGHEALYLEHRSRQRGC